MQKIIRRSFKFIYGYIRINYIKSNTFKEIYGCNNSIFNIFLKLNIFIL